MILVCLRCREEAVDSVKPVRDACWYCSNFTDCLNCVKCGFKVCVPCAKKLTERQANLKKQGQALQGDLAEESEI